MSTYFIPKYNFTLMDYSDNYITPLESRPKYLLVEVDDRNRECEDQKYSFFIYLEDMYLIKSGLNIIIGTKNKEWTLTHYEKQQADDNYYKLSQLLNLPRLN